jgi:hypothetical protein
MIPGQETGTLSINWYTNSTLLAYWLLSRRALPEIVAERGASGIADRNGLSRFS